MASQPLYETQVAVFVRRSGTLRRLVAAKGRGGKGVVFYPHRALNIELFGRDLRVAEEHVSVWLNSDTQKTQIHHTYKITGDPEIWKIDKATLIDNTRNNFCQLIWCATIPSEEARVDAKISTKKYAIREIPSYDESLSTLAVCYCVSDGAQPFVDLSHIGIALFEMNFGNVRIGLYYSYINLPSYPRGRVVSMSTSLTRINDSDPSGLQLGGGSISQSSVDGFVNLTISCMAELVDSHIRMIKDDLVKNMPEHADEIITNLEARAIINTVMPLTDLQAMGMKRFATMQGLVELGEEIARPEGLQ